MIRARNQRMRILYTVADRLQRYADCDRKVIFCCFDARTEQADQTRMKME